MTNIFKGSCLCKRVTFEIEGAMTAFYLCHCSRCRKVSGSAHGANLFSPSASVNWLEGKDFVANFKLSQTRFSRSFCRICSSALPDDTRGEYLVVPAGSLDCDIEMRPTGHIFCSSRANWDNDLESIPSYAEFK
ncbi:MAG: GFA family protein [Proteobacteria bacterium]|nr:GFA family protein [Pseudomonadota bacterium]